MDRKRLNRSTLLAFSAFDCLAHGLLRKRNTNLLSSLFSRHGLFVNNALLSLKVKPREDKFYTYRQFPPFVLNNLEQRNNKQFRYQK